MRRIPVLLAVTALAAAGLVGCSAASDDASCTRPSASPATFDLVDVSGSSDAAPEVELRVPFHVETTTALDVEVGDGVPVTSDSQVVLLDLSLVSGETGEPLVATPYDGDTSRAFPLSQWTATFPGLTGALQCATEGSRVVVALAPDDIAADAAEGLGLASGESAVAVVDLRQVFLPRANGADQYTEGRGLPSIVRAPDGRPGIIVPEAEAPTGPVVQVLKRGDGDEVSAESTVTFHFTSVEWDDPRDTVESSWDAAPATAALDEVSPVLADALEGETVGSQLLVVQPAPEAAEGEASESAIVYIVDILGVS